MRTATSALLLLAVSLSFVLTACEAEPQAPEATAADTTAAHERPDWVNQAVIYELFVRNFTPEGTFRAIIPRLQELKSLGVTTLWLMPIHPVGEKGRKGELGSPYAIQDYFDVNPRFGTKDDFRALVDAVHAAGMYLIIDFVANHTAPDNAWVTEHPDWYTQDAAGTPTHPEGTDWTDVADLNYDEPAVREAMQEALYFWVREFDIDGYRCDVAEMVPMDFWSTAIDSLHAIKPVMMLAEGENPELHAHGFDVTYSWKPYHALKDVWKGEAVSTYLDVVAEEQEAFPADALRLRFTTNHDETAWDNPPTILFGGQDGARAAAVMTALLPGIPLLYNGQEAGTDEKIPLFEKSSMDFSAHPEMRAFYTNLLSLHHQHPALQSNTFEVLAPEAEDVALFARGSGDDRLIVAVNVRDTASSIELPEALGTTGLVDARTGQPVPAADGVLSLPPYGYLIARHAAR